MAKGMKPRRLGASAPRSDERAEDEWNESFHKHHGKARLMEWHLVRDASRDANLTRFHSLDLTGLAKGQLKQLFAVPKGSVHPPDEVLRNPIKVREWFRYKRVDQQRRRSQYEKVRLSAPSQNEAEGAITETGVTPTMATATTTHHQPSVVDPGALSRQTDDEIAKRPLRSPADTSGVKIELRENTSSSGGLKVATLKSGKTRIATVAASQSETLASLSPSLSTSLSTERPLSTSTVTTAGDTTTASLSTSPSIRMLSTPSPTIALPSFSPVPSPSPSPTSTHLASSPPPLESFVRPSLASNNNDNSADNGNGSPSSAAGADAVGTESGEIQTGSGVEAAIPRSSPLRFAPGNFLRKLFGDRSATVKEAEEGPSVERTVGKDDEAGSDGGGASSSHALSSDLSSSAPIERWGVSSPDLDRLCSMFGTLLDRSQASEVEETCRGWYPPGLTSRIEDIFARDPARRFRHLTRTQRVVSLLKLGGVKVDNLLLEEMEMDELASMNNDGGEPTPRAWKEMLLFMGSDSRVRTSVVWLAENSFILKTDDDLKEAAKLEHILRESSFSQVWEVSFRRHGLRYSNVGVYQRRNETRSSSHDDMVLRAIARCLSLDPLIAGFAHINPPHSLLPAIVDCNRMVATATSTERTIALDGVCQAFTEDQQRLLFESWHKDVTFAGPLTPFGAPLLESLESHQGPQKLFLRVARDFFRVEPNGYSRLFNIVSSSTVIREVSFDFLGVSGLTQTDHVGQDETSDARVIRRYLKLWKFVVSEVSTNKRLIGIDLQVL